MVDDRIRDGRRIAQLLASELAGRSSGPLGDVAVVDADPEVEPTPGGSRAYDVALAGERVATVRITKRSARIAFAEVTGDRLPAVDGVGDVSIEPGEDGPVLVVESGAAVKRAVDAFVAAIE